MIWTGETEVLEEKPVPMRTFSTHNLTQTVLKSNPGWNWVKERRNKRDAMRITTFITSRRGKSEKFTLLQGPSQCPHVLLEKVGWKQGKALGSEQGSVLGSGFLEVSSRGKRMRIWDKFGVWRSASWRHLCRVRKVVFWQENFEVSLERTVGEAESATWIFGTPTHNLLLDWKSSKFYLRIQFVLRREHCTLPLKTATI